MRKRVLSVILVVALMAAILSVSAFAVDVGDIQTTDYGVLTILMEKLTLDIKAIFNVVNAIYTFFANLFQ